VASENTITKSKSYTRREATQLVMGVAALGLALGKTPAGAAEKTVAAKEKNLTKSESSIYIKLNATEKAMFLKLDAGERSNFMKHQDWSEAEKSTFLKVQSKD
jgi:hypothetical protein